MKSEKIVNKFIVSVVMVSNKFMSAVRSGVCANQELYKDMRKLKEEAAQLKVFLDHETAERKKEKEDDSNI